MDRMQFFQTVSTSVDLLLDGAVTSVGTSSIAVSIEVSAVDSSRTPRRLATSKFLMVSRSREDNRAQPVAKLNSPDGKHVAHPRKATSVEPSGWRPEEMALLHDLHRQRQIDASQFIWQSDCKDAKSVLMHSQARNVYGRIFGGHLMSQAYEIAWVAVYKLAREMPSPTFIDDVEFLRPVDIASVVSFEAQVVYTSGTDAIVDVKAIVHNPLLNETMITNTFHFGFQLDQLATQVVPERYDEMVTYVEGLRRCQSFQSIQNQD
uniref:HotDog ACOT-type domain-containing protein n=1 Tax=Spongospora subterranea TaxID=70186 RepID=A0A0H5QL17_9EUKA|eukprot:CRZ02292.1 hypothetical protein [Spongospora subterranea]